MARPIQIAKPLALPCGATLPNRLAKAAMTENLADEYGRATARHESLYRTWAQGGAGLLITGNVQVDRRYVERPGNICIDGEQDHVQLERLTALATNGKVAGGHIWMQIAHAGRQSNGKVNYHPVGPSAIRIKLPKMAFGAPRALEKSEINCIVEKFAYAAKIAKQAGFTGVQVHAAHGYLLSSFLNPLANNRTDEYGGSLSNRTRPLLEVVQAIRAAVGPAYPVSVKLNTADFQKGGFQHTEAIQVAKWLEKEGIDLLELSGGNYECPTICADSKLLDYGQDTELGVIRESTRKREAYYMTYCKECRAAVSTPIMLTGGFRHLSSMEAAIDASELDVVGIGRPLCGMPDACNQLLSGSILDLPKFEDVLPSTLGPQWAQRLGLVGPRASSTLASLVNLVAPQAWYYVNIYKIADREEVSPVGGCIRAYLRNDMEEGKIAKSLVGVNCHGSHHRPTLATTLRMLQGFLEILGLKVPLAACALMAGVYALRRVLLVCQKWLA